MKYRKNIPILVLVFLAFGTIAAAIPFHFPRTASAANAEATEKPKRQEIISNLNTDIAFIVSIVGLVGIGAGMVSSLNAVENRIKEQLVAVEKGLHSDILSKYEGIGKELSEVKREILAVQAQSQSDIGDVRREILKVAHKFETAMVMADSNYELLEKEHINLQKEVQNILRQFHDRLADLEAFETKKNGFTPRTQHLNLDIEGL